VAAGTTDYYDVLGVDRSASDDEIKKAFRRKARETHPDVSDASDAEERFKELNAAYDVLSDPSKRDQYDRFGTVGPTFGGGNGADLGDIFGGGSVDLGDLFSAFFGGVYGAAGGAVRMQGRDMATGLVVTLEEVATGVDKDIVVDRLAPCETCDATGLGPTGSRVTCPDCGGTGQRRTQRRTFLGVMESVQPCTTCGQTGSTIDHPCEECEGSGRVPDRQHITVTVPAGIADGMQLRLRGLGEAGIRGADAGDLIVTVRVASHEYLHREGDDLHCRATVSITQAALGGDIGACGLLEETTIHVPAGAQHGDTVRMKGQGMPRLRGSGHGDLYVHIAVEVPKKLTKRQKELLSELSAELGDAKRRKQTPIEKLKDWLTG
jgi:molecular chaperone DnaJ